MSSPERDDPAAIQQSLPARPSTPAPQSPPSNEYLSSPPNGLGNLSSDPSSSSPEAPSLDASRTAANEDEVDDTMEIINGDEHELDLDAEYLPEDYMQELRRVKVYELVDQNWKDLGTAFCSGEYDDTAREAQLVAKSELNQEILLQITVRVDDVYQRTADTLIVWTEPNGKDYALSFQDVEGCSEVWEFIGEVRRHLKSQDELGGSSSPFHEQPAPAATGKLPAPTLANIANIDHLLKSVARSPPLKERVAEYIVGTDYIRHLIKLMSDAEDLESTNDLHALCKLMQTILLLNDSGIYEYVLRDDLFIDMVGLLEYDPEFPQHKAGYRDFLKDVSRHHQVINFRDQSIQTKVHHIYRLQYLKDVVLARVLDDPTFNVISSTIIFYQIDIVNYIQNEEYFLEELFRLFQHPQATQPSQLPTSELPSAALSSAISTPSPQIGPPTPPASQLPIEPQATASPTNEDRRPAALLLLHQFCCMGKNVHIPMRVPLFRSLVDRGILWPVQWAFSHQDLKVLNTGGEILTMVLDHDAGGVRGHILRQVEEGHHPTLLQIMTEMMAGAEKFPELKSQLSESYRTLMDVPGPDATSRQLPGLRIVPRREEAQSEKFLDYFYKNCAVHLCRPFMDITSHKHIHESYLQLTRVQSDLYLYLCDLLCGFLLQHSYQSHFFILSSELVPHIAALLYAREKHLKLAALRFFRTCLRLNNRNLLLHLSKHEVFSPILILTKRESSRDNLLSSCCQEFFEHMRRENYKEVIDHIMKTYEPLVKELSVSPVVGARFQGLIRRWEMNNEPPPKVEAKPLQPIPRKGWGQGRFADAHAEEEYFNAEEEEGSASTAVLANLPHGRVFRRKGHGQQRRTRPSNNGAMSLPKPYPMGALVDYAEEEEGSEGADSTDEQPTTPTGITEPPRTQDSPRPSPVLRPRRPELTRTASQKALDLNGVPESYHSSQQQQLQSQQQSQQTSFASTSTSVTPTETNHSPTTRRASSELTPMPIEEDDDLIGPPVSLSNKRRREDDDEDEPLERLAKRPAHGTAPVTRRKSLEDAAAAAAAAGGSNPPTPTSGSSSGTSSSGKIRLKMSLSNVSATVPLVTPPAQDVKVGEKG